MNTAAARNPELVRQAADEFGAQCIVVAIDGRRVNGQWEVVLEGGRGARGEEPLSSGIDVVEWAAKAEELGAGEILLTSFDRDGTQDGYDLELTRAVSDAVGIPVIASGGAGELDHLAEGIAAGADAVLCASIFHYGRYRVGEAKRHLPGPGVSV